MAPVYWYSIPSPLKTYLDHWSAWMRVPGLAFKEPMASKTLALVTTSGDRGGSRHGSCSSESINAKARNDACAPLPVAITTNWRPDRVRYVIGDEPGQVNGRRWQRAP